MENTILTNIQRFSLHDGPGIRTTVFLKGCSLRCPWCSNPENQEPFPQEYEKDEIKGVYGYHISAEELVKECLKDRIYYQKKAEEQADGHKSALDQISGGVTFSGGEALLQMEALVPVCEALHENGVHLAAESCLFVPPDYLKLAIRHIDLFYVDVKILRPDRCREIEHGDLDLFLTNLELLMQSGKPVVIRIPVIGGYTDDPENRKAVHDLPIVPQEM